MAKRHPTMHPTWPELIDALRADMLKAKKYGVTHCYVDVQFTPPKPWWMNAEDLKLVDLLDTDLPEAA